MLYLLIVNCSVHAQNCQLSWNQRRSEYKEWFIFQSWPGGNFVAGNKAILIKQYALEDFAEQSTSLKSRAVAAAEAWPKVSLHKFPLSCKQRVLWSLPSRWCTPANSAQVTRHPTSLNKEPDYLGPNKSILTISLLSDQFICWLIASARHKSQRRQKTWMRLKISPGSDP